MSLARLATRAVVGGLFVGHGTQKLFGWFDGHGIEPTAQMFDQIGMRPGVRNAYAAGITEAGAGALFALGAATPLAAAGLIGTMTTAIAKVHAPNGPWVSQQGYEYNAVLIAACALIAEAGPGKLSIDALRGKADGSVKAGLGALLLGLAASYASMELAKRAPAGAPPAPLEEPTAAATADAG